MFKQSRARRIGLLSRDLLIFANANGIFDPNGVDDWDKDVRLTTHPTLVRPGETGLSRNACQYSTSQPKESLANAPRQDADCPWVIGVNICNAWRDVVTGRADRPCETFTALLRMSTPRSMRSRASAPSLTSLADISVLPELKFVPTTQHRQALL